jgi:hypothetical protein
MTNWPADKVERRKVAEEWKPIPTFDGYEASSLGRIRSVDRHLPDGRFRRGSILKPFQLPNGYLQVNLGANVRGYVHRFVCMAWHGEPFAKAEAAHFDGCKLNNSAENLRWATSAENEQDKRRHGTYQRPRVYKQPHHKKRGPQPSRHPQADKILAMRQDGATLAQIASFLGMSKSGAKNVLDFRCFNA